MIGLVCNLESQWRPVFFFYSVVSIMRVLPVVLDARLFQCQPFPMSVLQ